MATFRKSGKGWRAEVYKRGIRRSKVLPTKAEAKDWAIQQELELTAGKAGASSIPFGEVMRRYADEVSPSKKGARWEAIRINKLSRDRIAKIPIGGLERSHLSDWRDRRLREVTPSSVNREMQVISSVLSAASDDWGLIDTNPMRRVRRPKKGKPRDRLPTAGELERLGRAAEAQRGRMQWRVWLAFQFAIETGMRSGEIVGLRWSDVDLGGRVAHLPETKNGQERDVPLSRRAMELLEMTDGEDWVFGLTDRSRDTHWRRLRDDAGVTGLRFHDSRAEAVTRLSERLDLLKLARMIGHRDPRSLMVYYREPASEIAKLLD